MAETATEKVACENCGSDVRDGTTFCYNCGKPVIVAAEDASPEAHTSNGSAPVSDEAKAALDDLANKLKVEDVTQEDKLAQAAAERKQARVRARRDEVVWEAPDQAASPWFVAFTLIIVVLTGLVVFAALYWK
jgi:uncharacterized Zn finger protein (UPF0148 family)